jgi:hypothetical protein
MLADAFALQHQLDRAHRFAFAGASCDNMQLAVYNLIFTSVAVSQLQHCALLIQLA